MGTSDCVSLARLHALSRLLCSDVQKPAGVEAKLTKLAARSLWVEQLTAVWNSAPGFLVLLYILSDLYPKHISSFLYVSMYVCMYVCMYVSMYVCMSSSSVTSVPHCSHRVADPSTNIFQIFM